MVNPTLIAPYFVQPSRLVAHVIFHYESFLILFKILEKQIDIIKDNGENKCVGNVCYNFIKINESITIYYQMQMLCCTVHNWQIINYWIHLICN